MNRRLARLRAAQALYQMDMAEFEPNTALASVLDEAKKRANF